MKNKHIYGFDLIRAIAVLIIIITHYNGPFGNAIEYRSNLIVSSTIGGISTGALGNTLFFILSGATLMYNYGDQLDVKIFYKKRCLSIFPTFWLSYVLVLLYKFLMTKGLDFFGETPKVNFLWTLFGLDGYVSVFGIKTFYLVGQWFLGLIILYYLFFPLLRICVIRYPKLTAILGVILFVLCEIPNEFNSQTLPFDVLPQFLIGMYFVYFMKQKVKTWHFVGAIAIFIIHSIFPFAPSNSVVITIVGSATFLILFFLQKYLEKKHLCIVVNFICKYSYPIFLVHHFIILELLKYYNGYNFPAYTITTNWLMFFVCILFIFSISKWVYKLNTKMMEFIRN